ncbi:MAG: hypothetical protein GXP55_23675, partial [Deltaproteobacteria bacterium]|nr:hypothetical protein [Deltaproteobacteria bacterium]
MIRPCAALLVIGTLLPLATPARAQPSAASFLARAERERQRPRRQLAILRRGVTRLPGELELARALARALTPRDAASARLDSAEARHAVEARAALEAVVLDDPQTRHLLDLQLAWLRALTGDCSGASAEITQRDPRVDRAAALTLRQIAALAIRRGDLRVASVALDRARAADATFQGLDLSRAALACARGQDERAVALLRARLERHPADDPTRHALAGALL